MPNVKSVFFAVLTTSFIGPFMGSAVNLAIPSIGDAFHVPAGELSAVVSLYLFGSVAVLLPMGKLADIVGRKKLFAAGAALLAACSVGAGASSTLDVLLFWRFLQGAATAMIFSTGMAMLISVYPKENRGKAIGYSAAATYIGLSLGPMIGGMIAHYFGWRCIFYFTAAFLCLSLASILQVKEEWYGVKGARLDLTGSLLYALAGPAILYGCSGAAEHLRARYSLLFGVLALAAFVWRQSRARTPLVDIDLFRKNTVFAMSNLAAMINYSATFAIGFILSLYLQLVRGFDAPTAGMILLVQPIVMAAFSPKAGALSDRAEPRVVASVGMGLNALGLFLFTFLTADTAVWMIGANLALIGLGFALFSSPNNNAIMGAVDASRYGVASSVLAAMRLFGQAMSMAVVTATLSAYAADALAADYLADLLGGFQAAFGAFAALCALGVLASMARGRRAA